MSKLLPLAATLLVACIEPSSPAQQLQAEESSIVLAHFSTGTSIPQNPPPNVSADATGPAARAIFEATLALAPEPSDLTISMDQCPVDFGVSYYLEFSSETSVVANAGVDAGGCLVVDMTDARTTAVIARLADEPYFATVAANLGIPESTIFPYIAPQ
ncbi:MAG TPA: hypothetical protein VMJ10_12610 [Kofleriaceae bacterium]|nr:hypothetical protein [Kofleriaceae bacterium]